MLKYLFRFYNMLLKFSTNRVDEHGAQYIAFGVFGVINYPISFIMWSEVVPQSYASITLRLIATLLCVLLIFKKYWPENFKKHLPLYWHATLLFSLPFFGTFMLLMNHASDKWLINDALGFFLYVLLVDWLSFIVLLTIGIIFGFVVFLFIGGQPHLINKSAFSLAVYMYVLAIIIGVVFSRNKGKIEHEKLITIKAFASSIAHEIRNPLGSLHLCFASLEGFLYKVKKIFPLLTEKQKKQTNISEKDMLFIDSATSAISEEIASAKGFVDMLLMNIREKRLDRSSFDVFSIKECLESATARYPFSPKEMRDKVVIKIVNDFKFFGSEEFMIYIIFNLYKNAIEQIQHRGDGKIVVSTSSDGRYNTLLVEDNGDGIPRNILRDIFKPFYSASLHGTGLGLYFCKRVMYEFGGNIECLSEVGNFTRFVLSFPQDKG